MSSKDIKSLLWKSKTVAIVGLSRSPQKDSNLVANYLQSKGYRIIPVNPIADMILGEKCYNTIIDIPKQLFSTIDIVDIFRPSKDVSGIVDQIIEMKMKFNKPDTIWMQLGIIDDDAAKRAREVGIFVVMNKCIMISHKQMFRNHL